MRLPRRNVIKYATLALALGACSDDDGERHTISFTSTPSPLTFAAAQVGDGPWQVVTPSNGTFSFEAAGDTYGVVAVCEDEGLAMTTVLHATVGETTTPSFDCFVATDPAATLGGTVSGASAGEILVGYYQYGTPATYSLMAPAGTWDVFALDRAPTQGPARFVRKNGVSLTDGAATVLDFDFAGEAVPFESRAISLAGLEAGETVTVTNRIRTKPGGTAFTMTATPDAYRALPATQLRGDDVQVVTAGAGEGSSYRAVSRWYLAPEDLTATLPAPPPPSQVDSEAAQPYIRMRASIPASLDADVVDLVYDQPRQEQSHLIWSARLSRGYRDAVDASTYSLPDLSALAGFDLGWGLAPATPVYWQVIATSSDAPAADLLGSEDSVPAHARTDAITQQAGQFP